MKHFRQLACSFLVCFLLLPFASFPASAASNTDAILSSLRSGVMVNGKEVAIPESYINQTENYFIAHQISDAQAEYILAEIAGAKAALQQAGVTDLKKMDSATKQRILAAAQASANEIDLKLTVDSDKNIKMTDSNGSIAFSNDNVIKTTGPSVDWQTRFLLFAGIFALLLAVPFFLIHKYKLTEN